MNYLWIKTCLLFVQFVTKKEENASFLLKIQRDIANIAPSAIVKAKKKQGNKGDISNKLLVQALLYLNPKDRIQIIHSWLDTFPTSDPEVQKIHDYLEMVSDSIKKSSAYSYSSTRIYKYSLRIDEAIYNKRYSLAIKLSNRCLQEYYYLYLKQKNKLYNYSYYKKDARLLYQHIIDYLNPYSSKEEQEELLSIALFTNSLSSMVDDMRDGKSSPDKYTTAYLEKGMKEVMEYLKGK